MIRAVTEYLSECGRLLFWVYLKPSSLQAHLKQIAPGIVEKRRSLAWLYEIKHNQALRSILFKAISFNLFFPFLMLCAATLNPKAADLRANDIFLWAFVTSWLANGLFFCVACITIFGFTSGVSSSVILGSVFNVTILIAFPFILLGNEHLYMFVITVSMIVTGGVVGYAGMLSWGGGIRSPRFPDFTSIHWSS